MNKIPLLSTGMVQTILNSDMTTEEKARKIVHDVNDYYDRCTDGANRQRCYYDTVLAGIKEWELEIGR